MTDKQLQWVEVSLLIPESAAEVTAEYLHRLTGLGVELKDWGPEGDYMEIVGYLPLGAELRSYRRSLEQLKDRLQKEYPEREIRLGLKDLPPEDWSVNWKRYFHPPGGGARSGGGAPAGRSPNCWRAKRPSWWTRGRPLAPASMPPRCSA